MIPRSWYAYRVSHPLVCPNQPSSRADDRGRRKVFPRRFQPTELPENTVGELISQHSWHVAANQSAQLFPRRCHNF